MATPVRTKGLRNLQRQMDARFPNRVKPDGWIGNEEHRKRISGHNPDDTAGSKPAWNGDPDSVPEVRAIDVAADLGDGWRGRDLVAHLITLPNLGTVVRYLIHEGQIWHSRTGFQPEDFDGDAHTGHVHVEGAWSQAGDENETYDFHLERIMAEPTAAQIADAVWDEPIKMPDGRTVTARQIMAWRDDVEIKTRDVITAEIRAAVGPLTAEPSETHPIVKAIRWAAAHPAE
jgi:hypothetical protein